MNAATSLSDLLAAGVNIDAIGTIIINNVKGDYTMTDKSKKIGDIHGSSFGDNVNIQGDEVSQSKITLVNNPLIEEAFQNLFAHIEGMDEEIAKEQAKFNAEILKESLEKNEKSKGGKFLKFLVGSLGVVEPLVTIAQIAGIPLPNLPIS